MIFFEYEQVVKIHSTLISKTGGMDGVRDEKLLDSAIKAPFQTFGGKDLYPEILDKASQLCYSLIENHSFADGNKRIGVHLTLLFLKINNIELSYTQKDSQTFFSERLRFFESHGRGSRSCRTLDEQLPETASWRENSRHDIQKMLQFLTENWGIILYKLPML